MDLPISEDLAEKLSSKEYKNREIYNIKVSKG